MADSFFFTLDEAITQILEEEDDDFFGKDSALDSDSASLTVGNKRPRVQCAEFADKEGSGAGDDDAEDPHFLHSDIYSRSATSSYLH